MHSPLHSPAYAWAMNDGMKYPYQVKSIRRSGSSSYESRRFSTLMQKRILVLWRASSYSCKQNVSQALLYAARKAWSTAGEGFVYSVT